jgi:hypothetical protein
LTEKVLELIRIQYYDFNVQHLLEVHQSKHNISLSYSTLWSGSQKNRLLKAHRMACRAFQDRLCLELRVQGIKNMSEAKRYLYETFMPSYWEKNCTPKPLAPEPADMPLENKTQLVLILCVEHYRKIAKGQTFIWNEIEH